MTFGTYISNPANGIESTLNTTTTATTSYTGTAEQNPFPDVMVSCKSDVAGTLFFDFSTNGSDWDTFPSSGFSVAANIHEFHTAVKGPRYFRLRWSSSSTPTSFRIYTYYGVFRQPNAPLNQPLGLDSDAILVRPSFPWLDIARGLSTGVTSIKKFGRNNAVGTSFVPVCLGGVYQTPQSGSATALRVAAGGNANDTAAGSGARELTLTGLDENFELATESIATAGASASSATITTFTRLFLIDVSSSGSYATASSGSHAGSITIENSAGGTTWGIIDGASFPKGGSEIGAYTIPSGSTGYVNLRNVSIDSGKTVDVVFFSRANCHDTAAPYSNMRARSVITGVAGGSIEVFGDKEVPLGPFVGPTDIGAMAKVNSATASVSIEFEIILVNE